MKSVFQKIISVSLMIIMLLSALPFTASAKSFSGKCGENLTWTFDESSGELVISGTGKMYDYDFHIYEYRPWNSYDISVKSVIIGNGVTSIGSYAFGDCSKLVNVTIGNSVTSIGERAFCDCDRITSIEIPDNVTAIGVDAFLACDSLRSVTVGAGVVTIGEWAFFNDYSLTGIFVDSDNQYYSSDSYGVLYNKNKTELIQFPCDLKIASYTIPDSVTVIGYYAFGMCDNLEIVTIPDSVTVIGDYAFVMCDSLASVTVSNSVTAIENSAFYYCDSLKDIYYFGTQEEWHNISIGHDNDSLFDATIHFLLNDVYDVVVTLPTCTEKGYSTYTCSCGESKVDDYVDALGHSFGEWEENVPATCTQKGEELRYCSRCDETESKSIPMLEHNYTETATVPTCKDKGYTTYTCECGDSYVDDYVDALGHSFGEWEENVPATCTQKGEELRCCSRCDEIESKSIPMLEHNYTETITAPTCEDEGYTTYTCECGDSYNADYVDAAGHTAGEWIVISPATTTQTGIKTQRCSVCDELLNVDTIPTLPAKVYRVSVSDVSLDYKASTSITLSVNADPGAKHTLTYSSSNPSVAFVDENGHVTATGIGNATITCTVTDENGNIVSDTCEVEVKYNWWQWIIVIVLFGWIWY